MQAESVIHADLTAKQSKWICIYHIHLIVIRSWNILIILKVAMWCIQLCNLKFVPYSLWLERGVMCVLAFLMFICMDQEWETLLLFTFPGDNILLHVLRWEIDQLMPLNNTFKMSRVTAVDGQYQIGIYTVRPIAFGEEITFDYNSVTEVCS